MSPDRRNINLIYCIAAIPWLILFAVIYYYIKPKKVITSPVEEIQTIDSLKKVNNTIIIEVEHLDSIKNEKIIKVKELDNDSTLKLFYELLGK